jgi:hypothetical protein
MFERKIVGEILLLGIEIAKIDRREQGGIKGDEKLKPPA